MGWTKLDGYDYEIYPGIIIIKLSGTNDPDIGDIMSELYGSNGLIYLEGYRFKYQDNYKIVSDGVWAYLKLEVLELEECR